MAAARMVFFFNDTATTEIYTLSLHDALPILRTAHTTTQTRYTIGSFRMNIMKTSSKTAARPTRGSRSEEHTSELQSRQYLVCRLLLEKKLYGAARRRFEAADAPDLAIARPPY